MACVDPGGIIFNIMMTTVERRKISQQELMIRARAMLRKYQNARINVSGGTDISGASTGGGGGCRGFGPGGGGRGASERLNTPIPGPDIGQRPADTVKTLGKDRT